MDTFSKEKRSEIMSKIKGKDTKPEKIVRSLLHSMGYRFRIHRKDLPGHPDIVLPKHKTAIFVHGCFWHGHDDLTCKYSPRIPKTNTEYWRRKINNNKSRDFENIKGIQEMGWKAIVLWECQVKHHYDFGEKLSLAISGIVKNNGISRTKCQTLSAS